MSLIVFRTTLGSVSTRQSALLLQQKQPAVWRPTGFAIQLESGGAGLSTRRTTCRTLSSSSRRWNAKQLSRAANAEKSGESSSHRLQQPSANSSLAPPSAQHSPIRNIYTDPALKLPRHFGKNQEQIVSEETKKILEKVVGHFRAVRWAVAYGSGVFDQAGYNPNGVSLSASGKEPDWQRQPEAR